MEEFRASFVPVDFPADTFDTCNGECTSNYWRCIINWISDTTKYPMHYIFTLILLCVVNRREAWVSSPIISKKAQLRAPLSPCKQPGPVSTLICIIVGRLFAGREWSSVEYQVSHRHIQEMQPNWENQSNICESVWLPQRTTGWSLLLCLCTWSQQLPHTQLSASLLVTIACTVGKSKLLNWKMHLHNDSLPIERPPV